ncbi:GntR family transcriptional regulator [Kushneria konosiri]|uniref:GntR family transcriptional regulator n=2 Tax=Kushneria konosiri TaxID=698828 RepID=A0A2Z2HFW7_9GAMM|nr:GntR family transcriptional regulator [Kushneria konosiri]
MVNMKTLKLERITQQGSLSAQIARQLEASIANGQIAVGDKLPTESALCDMFGVSRTAVREAIAHLRSLGLIETRRGIGTRVIQTSQAAPSPARRISAHTVEDILHVLELRLTLEPRAAALAAERHDDDDVQRLESAHAAFMEAVKQGRQARHEDYQFHHALIEATHNPFFMAFYEPLSQEAIPRARLVDHELNVEAARRYLEMVAGEHQAILDAVLSRDPERAEQAVRQHFSRARQTYSDYR